MIIFTSNFIRGKGFFIIIVFSLERIVLVCEAHLYIVP